MHEGVSIGLTIGKLLRIPVIFDFQGSLTGEMVDHNFLDQDSHFYRPLRWLETRLDRLSPVILTSSHHARQLLINDFACRPERVETVPDCVDSEVFSPPLQDEQVALAEQKAALGIPAERKIVVYLGLLTEYQGTDALLQSAAHLVQQHRDVHFLIMGFPAVDYYQHMAHRLGVADHTTFTGKVPYPKARGLLALGDVAVAPKMSATEGSGKILNYMAMGLPTVAFDVPVSHEYLGDLGLYATPGDPGSLAQVLAEGLFHDTDRQRGAKLRRLAIEAYSWDRAAETILRAYQTVCH
jgi:glycosyltransferase involved in cell wall biosynthesis